MQVTFTDKSISSSGESRDLAERKLQRLARYFSATREAHITHTRQRQQEVVEIQLDLDGRLLRAEARGDSFRTALDEVVERLESQVRRTKEKLRRHKGRTSAVEFATLFTETEEEQPEQAEPARGLVKRKRFTVKPMNVDEAILQMEMLHHSFFAFRDAGSGEFNVLYRRDDGNYGLLELADG